MAEVAPSGRRRRWDIPPVYLLAACVLMVGLHVALPIARLVPWPWTLAGLLPIAAGVALAAVAARGFKRAGTAIVPFEPSTALVADGPFRHTRNPMYLGMLLALSGLLVLLGTLGPVIVLPAFFWLIQSHFVVPEEQHMERHFGAQYDAYRGRVRRWL